MIDAHYLGGEGRLKIFAHPNLQLIFTCRVGHWVVFGIELLQFDPVWLERVDGVEATRSEIVIGDRGIDESLSDIDDRLAAHSKERTRCDADEDQYEREVEEQVPALLEIALLEGIAITESLHPKALRLEVRCDLF